MPTSSIIPPSFILSTFIPSMAASSSKKICEHLQEQQESFVLEIQRPSMSNLTRRRILRTRKILKLIFYKLICSNHSKQKLNCHKAHVYELKLLQSGGSKRYSSRGSSVAWYESSMCGMKDSPCKKNQAAVLGETCQPHERSSFIEQQCKEDGEKLGPGSLPIEAIPSNTDEEEDASTSSNIVADEDSIFSAFLWELLVKQQIEKQNHAGFLIQQEKIDPGFCRILENRRILQQTKQLLFDCIKEAIERHQRKDKNQKLIQESMDLEELGKIICENICPWGNQNGAQHLNFDVSSIIEEWDDVQKLHRKIEKDIGDAIMDEIIQEIIGFLCSVKYCVH